MKIKLLEVCAFVVEAENETEEVILNHWVANDYDFRLHLTDIRHNTDLLHAVSFIQMDKDSPIRMRDDKKP